MPVPEKRPSSASPRDKAVAPKPAEARPNSRPERRRTLRVSCAWDVLCYPSGKAETQYRARILEISAGGIRLFAERRFKKGDSVTVRFRAEQQLPLSRVHVTVVEVIDFQKDRQKGNSTLCCQFRRELSPTDLEALLQSAGVSPSALAEAEPRPSAEAVPEAPAPPPAPEPPRFKLVIYPAVSEQRLARIREAAHSTAVVQAVDEAAALREIVDADALFGYVTPPLLRAATKLRWAQSPTASMEKYLYPELAASPVTVTNMRGIFSDVIADHVFGFILCFAKNFHIYVRQQTRGVWQAVGRNPNELPGYGGPGEVEPFDRAAVTLAGATLGLVGMGGIGAETARRGLAFGMRVLGVDPAAQQAPEGVTLWRPDRLGEMLSASDFVVIAAPHTPDTYKLIHRERLRQMKRSAYLINVGRGVIVDLDDLTEALQAGDIAGAGLDVFEVEPLPADHPLWSMENVIITPHIAAASPRIAERHLTTLLDNLRRFQAGEPLTNVVDKHRWF
jgi:phosphoglycerate dehydrogenase-like enzyme